jgi:WD40 repeat protein
MPSAATQPSTRPAEADPVPRILPAPPEPKKGQTPKPDPNAAFVGPDGFKLIRPQVLEHDREIVFAQFSPCGKFLFAGSYDGRLYRWTLDDNAITVIAGHGGWLQSLVFHPDGKRAFSADSWGQILAWNYADEEPKPLWKREECHKRWMRSMTISPDGATFATCGGDRAVRTWSTEDGTPRGELAILPDDLLAAHFHPDGALLVGDLMGKIHQFDIQAKKVTRSLDASVLHLHPTVSGVKEINDVGGVRAMISDPQGKYLIAGGSQPATSGFVTGKPTVLCFDFATGKLQHTWQWTGVDPSEVFVMGLAWHPNGYALAASSGQPAKGAISGWKPGDAKEVFLAKTFSHSRSIAIHPDGKRVAVVQVMIRQGEGAGNGRKTNKNGEYVGLYSQVKLFDTSAT